MGKNRRGRVDSSSSSCSVSSIEDYTSEEDYEDSRREKRNKTKRIPARAKQSYSNDSNSELDLPQTKDKHTNENVLPSVGCYRRKKIPCHPVFNEYSHLRKGLLNSRVVGAYPRLILMHLFATLLLYFLLFPFVNCMWSYIVSINYEMATLFEYIVEEPVHESTLVHHFQKMRWLSWPPITPASFTLLLAATVKDHVFLHWENALDDVSLSNLMMR